jgi:transposase-like protein
MFNFFEKTTPSEAPLQKAHCPYCSFELEKIPTRRQKCKSCGNEYVVRTHYITKDKIVLKEKDAEIYDTEKDKYYLDKSLIDGIKMYINIDNNVVDKLVEKTQTELDKKFGKKASLGDVAWSIANKMILDASKKGDMNMLRSIYFQMGLYLHKTGRDSYEIMSIENSLQLKEYKKNDFVKKVEVLATTDSCEHCKLNNNKIFDIDEALEKKILPCRECTYKLTDKAKNGWCRCCYAPSID